MWLLIVVCFSLFAAAIHFVPDMTWPMYWRVLTAAGVSSAACVALFELWLRKTLRRREYTTDLLNRVSAGDLATSASEIKASTRSVRMANALRGLVANLERTIRRFGQLATDVSTVSGQITGRALNPATGVRTAFDAVPMHE